MLLAVSIACLVAMAACLAIAAREFAFRRGPTDSRSTYAALAIALAFALLAAAVAAVDEKVASPASASAGGTTTTTAPSGTVQSYPVSADDLRSFRGFVNVQYQPTGRRLCLVNYFNGAKELGNGRSYKFWARCGASDALSTVADVQERLALPSAWGPRNARVIACIPRGATLPYVSGRAAPQWSEPDRHRYLGGMVQYRVFSFDTNWIVERQTVPAAPKPLTKVGNPCS